MLNKLSVSPRVLFALVCLATGLLAGLSWVESPIRILAPHPVGSSSGSLFRKTNSQSLIEAQTLMPISLPKANANHDLDQTAEKKSLMAAVTEAKYSIRKTEHGPTEQKPESYDSSNPTHSLSVRFTRDAIHVDSLAGSKWKLSMRLKGYGYGRRLVPVITGKIKAEGNRIEFNKHLFASPVSASLTEWYVNKPEGLEQGFTVYERPASPKKQTGNLRMSLEVSGDLHGEVAEDGLSMRLKDRNGLHLFTYDHLKAWDADHHELASQMRLRGRELILEIEDSAAKYPITIDPTLWQQQYQLRSTDAARGDAFGTSVAISGNTAIVGASEDGGVTAGSAYIFVRDGSKWSQQQKLTPNPFGKIPEGFGASVAISGDTAVVGAIFTSIDNNTGGVNQRQGAVYVYVRNGTAWLPQQSLTAGDGRQGDLFGSSLALNDNTLIVGSPVHFHEPFTWQGAAYVFTRTESLWTQQQELTGDKLQGSRFASDVALSGETAIIRGGNDPGTIDVTIGKVYFFDRFGGVWTETQEVTANDRVPGDYFTGVAISGDTAFVGYSNISPDNITPANPARQGAYVFARIDGIWSQHERLTISETLRPHAGMSVALDRDTAIIGFPNFDDGDVTQTQGSAYLFVRSGGLWFEERKLIAADGRQGDNFGAPGDYISYLFYALPIRAFPAIVQIKGIDYENARQS